MICCENPGKFFFPARESRRRQFVVSHLPLSSHLPSAPPTQNQQPHRQLLQDVCAFLRLHCDVSYVGPATRVADLAVASARKRALEKKRAGFLGFAGLVGKGKKKEKETEVEGSSSSTASSSSSFSSLPEPSPIQIEEGLVDLFLSLEERFDLSFSAKGDGEAKAAKAVTVAEVSALLAREIELINKSLRHIEII